MSELSNSKYKKMSAGCDFNNDKTCISNENALRSNLREVKWAKGQWLVAVDWQADGETNIYALMLST